MVYWQKWQFHVYVGVYRHVGLIRYIKLCVLVYRQFTHIPWITHMAVLTVLFTAHRNYCVNLLHKSLWIITNMTLLRKSVMLWKSGSSGKGARGTPQECLKKKRVLNGGNLMNLWKKMTEKEVNFRNEVNPSFDGQWGALSSIDFTTP